MDSDGLIGCRKCLKKDATLAQHKEICSKLVFNTKILDEAENALSSVGSSDVIAEYHRLRPRASLIAGARVTCNLTTEVEKEEEEEGKE